MMNKLTTILLAILATGVSLFGDVYINEATRAGSKYGAQLAIGCLFFALSGLIWFFVFKRLSFSGVVLLYLFLSVMFAVTIDYFRYQHIPDLRAWIGLVLFLVAIWLMRDYLKN